MNYTKSFIALREVVLDGDPVDCIYYFDPRSRCMIGQTYDPTLEEEKKYCQNIKNYRKCPRFKAYQLDLEMRRGIQPESNGSSTE